MSDKIGNRFHGSSCSLRYNGTECTCGWDERRKQEALENLHRRATLNLKKAGFKKNESAIKELIYAMVSEDASAKKLCQKAEQEYNALVYTSEHKGEPLRELVRMARIIARGYIYEVGVDSAPQPEEQPDDITDMAFKVLEGSWISRTYTGDKK